MVYDFGKPLKIFLVSLLVLC